MKFIPSTDWAILVAAPIAYHVNTHTVPSLISLIPRSKKTVCPYEYNWITFDFNYIVHCIAFWGLLLFPCRKCWSPDKTSSSNGCGLPQATVLGEPKCYPSSEKYSTEYSLYRSRFVWKSCGMQSVLGNYVICYSPQCACYVSLENKCQ